ncbi:hypothetical protein LZC95_02620 [Pendulispora brunnea]|uniref:Uncharacterized protein n=1 Tax=Pendulispora brunnea TaxID=2905690 RepID=A0ABZ2KAN4_9BACT
MRLELPPSNDASLSGKGAPVVSTETAGGARGVRSYEYVRRGTNELALNLWTLVSRAKDLFQMFNAARAFCAWYNQSPVAEEKNANHPREQTHRMLDDLVSTAGNNGIVGVIENQCDQDLILDDWIHWYGWVDRLKIPQIIGSYETRPFDCVYSGAFWHTAAVGFRYRIGKASPGQTQWYAYICFYNNRFSSNYTYVYISRNKNESWDTLYDAMESNSSIANGPTGCPYLMSSAITLNYRAGAYAQVAQEDRADLLTSLKYALLPWRTPVDYKDEL